MTLSWRASNGPRLALRDGMHPRPGRRSSSWTRVTLLLCLAGGSLALAPTPLSAQDDEEKPEVVDLKFQGVKSLKVAELRESIVTDESHCKSLVFKPVCWF